MTTFITGLMLDLHAGVETGRAYRGPKDPQNNGSSKLKSIYAQFPQWSDANEVAQVATLALMKSPYTLGGQ